MCWVLDSVLVVLLLRRAPRRLGTHATHRGRDGAPPWPPRSDAGGVSRCSRSSPSPSPSSSAQQKELAERFLFMAGDAANEDAWRVLKATRAPVLSKPFTPQALVHPVEQVSA